MQVLKRRYYKTEDLQGAQAQWPTLNRNKAWLCPNFVK
jgi:hypothetical protein